MPRAQMTRVSDAPARNVMRAERYAHVLRLEEYFVAPRTAFAAHARCLGAAERLAQIAHVLAVDEAHAGFNSTGDAKRAAGALGPDVTRQAVGNIVGEVDSVGFVVARDQAGHRAQDFFLLGRQAIVDGADYHR